MKIIAVAEERSGKFKKSSFETVRTAADMAKTLRGEFAALVVGDGTRSIAAELGRYGAGRVIVVDHPLLARRSSRVFTRIIAHVCAKEDASMVFLPASQMGKDIAPRVAVRLKAGLAADCISLKPEGENIIATRPVFAGKALSDVRITTTVKIFTLRPNVFPATSDEGIAHVETMELQEEPVDNATFTNEVRIAAGRPDVTEAEVIVSGGRGMKGPEHFDLIESLADVLGAGVGASRAVVDAGWRPHDEQVGQTGKTVSPTLYIACGISGAVQHLAGMSSSKYIVAVNKDKDAPIFQVADYGIAGDVFEVLPALTAELKKVVGK